MFIILATSWLIHQFTIMAIIIPVAMVFFAVFITSVHGLDSTCDACKCSLSNVEFISDLIDETINTTVTPRLEEFSASFKERIEVTLNLDEEISTVNNTLSAISAITDGRMTTVSTKVDALDVKIARRSSQPGKVYSASYNIKMTT